MNQIENVAFQFECNENWEIMKPCNGGCHCSVCEKTVYDFSTISLEEYHQIVSKNHGSVCGKFSKRQTVYNASSHKIFNSKWVAAIMIFFGFSSCDDVEVLDHNQVERNHESAARRQTLGVPIMPMENRKDVASTKQSSKKLKMDSTNNVKMGKTAKKDFDMVLGAISIEEPEYLHGGEEGLMKFLSENIVIKDSSFGTIIVKFIIDTNGKVKDASISKSLSELNDAEVLSVVKKLEFTKPISDTYYSLPITICGE